MTKRTSGKFKRRKNDSYDTPPEAVLPLLPHLKSKTCFDEPCAGKGLLSAALISHGHICLGESDIKPRVAYGQHKDAMKITTTAAEVFITNPPWTRQLLHPLILHLSSIAPTWLLFDADWMHTVQAEPYLKRCRKIVSIGRVSWMQNGVSGFDNCAWYFFGFNDRPPTKFYGRKKAHVHD